MSDIVIGKHTLESLTTGMYSDPFVVYREYIQNCVDSIDSAIEKGIMSIEDSVISIRLDPAERCIIIKDNGVGISVDDAEKTLISIGNSKKTSSVSRGFRGIGRLAALSYCSKLLFRTSCLGESHGVEIIIDADKLSQLLLANDADDTSVVDVLQQVYSSSLFVAKEAEHYFEVILIGVDPASGLNEYSEVYDYLSQCVPVPFNPNCFVFGKEIDGRLKKAGFVPQAYNIYLQFGSSVTQVFKPYKDHFLVDKSKLLEDSIKDVEIIKIISANSSLVAIGWIGTTSYYGSIYDKTIKGLRLRKGNILVGDNQTLNIIFKDARFNGWSIGEIYAIDPLLLPNARRDNFEKNATYFSFIEQLTSIAVKITKEIRAASLNRNTTLKSALEQATKTMKDVASATDSGVISAQKGTLKQKISIAQDVISSTSSCGELDSYYQEIAFDELDMLIGRVQGATSYKALNAIDSLTNTERKILEKVFNTILETDSPDCQKIIDRVIDAFAKK